MIQIFESNKFDHQRTHLCNDDNTIGATGLPSELSMSHQVKLIRKLKSPSSQVQIVKITFPQAFYSGGQSKVWGKS
jgi:hypothetical protein